ncbi:hypothetical protein ACM15_18725 [Parabacteroides goldsteinii]|uniref:Uncharacterized protein n=2 Tax=Parabacteroides goldsteinii TaxID=328812 RepID=A0A0J6C771_9BACT|nr:hypothetical protein ACM15_18725 [Parabacteroides goldsteinii]
MGTQIYSKFHSIKDKPHMTPQEILASLSRLESELQEVASARLLVEQTTQSYKEVQQEIRSFVAEFHKVVSSLNSISNALDEGQTSLSDEANKSVEIIKAQLLNVHDSFVDQCNNVIVRFAEKITEVRNKFSTETVALSATYEKNNSDFRSSITELSKIHVALIKATESVTSLKADISTLESQLNDSQKEQDVVLSKISEGLKSTGYNHTRILNQISDELKSLHAEQDSGIKSLQHSLDVVSDLQKQQKSTEEQIHNSVKNVLTNLDSRMNMLDVKVDGVRKTANMIKILGIINTIGLLLIMLLMFVR